MFQQKGQSNFWQFWSWKTSDKPSIQNNPGLNMWYKQNPQQSSGDPKKTEIYNLAPYFFCVTPKVWIEKYAFCFLLKLFFIKSYLHYGIKLKTF